MWHDGKPVTADDVVFSMDRIVDPKDPKVGAAALTGVTTGGTKKIDDKTVEITLSTPNVLLDENLAERSCKIVPVGFDPKAPIGSGPFKMLEMKPGESFKWEAFADYWGDAPVRRHPHHDRVRRRHGAHQRAAGRPDPDDVDSCPTAGQGHRGDRGARAPQRRDRRLESVHDARRRQAVLRRPGAPGDAADRRPPADDRPDAQRLRLARQRHVRAVRPGVRQRPARSASRTSTRPSRCSAEAGQEGLRSSSFTGDDIGSVATVAAANLFAEQAKAAGVDVKVKKKTPFYDDDYLSYPFAQDFWNTRNYIPQAAGHLPRCARTTRRTGTTPSG